MVCILTALFLLAHPAIVFAAQSPAENPKIMERVRAGLEASRENRLDDAAAEFEAIIKLAPDFAEAYMNLGLARHRQGKLEAAIDAFQRALKLKPDLKGVNAVLGLDLLMVGRIKDAVASLEAEFRADPSNVDVNSWLGLAYLESGQYRNAIERLEAARNSRAEDLDVLYYLGNVYMKLSGELYDALFRLGPESARAHQATAEAHALSGRVQEAIKEYRRVIELNPQLPGVRAALGELYVEASDFPNAEEVLRAELKLRPFSARASYEYGAVLVKLGRSSEALPHLERAVSLDPTLAEAFYQLGKAYSDQESLQPAEKAWMRVTELQKEGPLALSTYYQLGQLYKKQGKHEEAKRALSLFNQLQSQAMRKAASPK